MSKLEKFSEGLIKQAIKVIEQDDNYFNIASDRLKKNI